MCVVDSGRAIQGCRQRPDYEAKLLQDHGCQPVSGGDSVLEEGVGVEGGRAIGTRQIHARTRACADTDLLDSSRTSTWRSRLRQTIRYRTYSRCVTA